MPPEYLIQDRPNPGQAPKCKADELRSFGMPQRQWPDPPPKPPKPPPPVAPSSTADQQRSALDPPRIFPADQPAAGRSSRAPSPRPMNRAAQSQSSVFGPPPERTPPPPPPKTPQTIATSTKAAMVSSVFGTPRQYEPPPAMQRNPPSGPQNSKAAQGQSSVFGSPRYTAKDAPQQSPRQAPSNANSRTAQGRSSSLPGTDWSSHEPSKPTRPPPPVAATDSVAQNASTVFGTPRRPTPAPLLSEQGKGGGSAKAFAPGEWAMPSPRDPALGAPKTRNEASVSSSLPGTRYPPPPPKPPKEAPPPAARSKAEQGRSSSLPGTDWSAVTAASAANKSDAAEGPRLDPASKAARNVSSVFGPPPPRPAAPTPPPPAAPAPYGPKIATSTAEQQQSSIFGSPRRPSPQPYRPEAQKYAASLHMDVPRAASPIKPRHKPRDPNGFYDERGKPRAPNTKAEQQVSSILGGSLGADAQERMSGQHRVSKSLIRIDFTGLPSDCNTSRLHQGLSAVPFDQGITCDVRKINVPYDALNGRAKGSGSAQFRNVPNRERLLSALKLGQEKGWLKAGSWKVTYDDTKPAAAESTPREVVQSV